MKNLFTILIFLLFINVTYSQDYTEIDNYARSVKYTRDLAKLTDKLTSPYSDDLSKVRAIFTCLDVYKRQSFISILREGSA